MLTHTQPALRKLDIAFGFPSYGGNGGIASEVPAIRKWWGRTLRKAMDDPRVGEVYEWTLSDTPAPMVRNRFVHMARAAKAHVLVMIDSDQDPDLHAGEAWYKPFFETALDALYAHYDRGPLVLFAPYCGPPPVENVYVFQWTAENSGHGPETPFRLKQYTREQAESLGGIREVAAGPTGLIMYDMRLFDLMEPPYFRYEYTDQYEHTKASTEDVQNLRDLAILGVNKLGYNPVRCCWDSWIGHHKPYNVGKPQSIGTEHVAETLRRAIEANRDSRQREIVLQMQDDVQGKTASAERIDAAEG